MDVTLIDCAYQEFLQKKKKFLLRFISIMYQYKIRGVLIDVLSIAFSYEQFNFRKLI